MKRLVSCVLTLVILLSMWGVFSVIAADDISIVINGVKQNYDVMPVIVNGRTLVPMRAIFESLGADVTWIDATDTIVGFRDRKYIKLRLNSDTVYINGIEQEEKIDVPATIIDSRTYVPVRFISETLGEKVGWDADTKTVHIESDYLKNVAVSDNLATLPSTMHRDIPTQFTRSNDLSDLIYYEENEKEQVASDILSLLPAGVEIFSNDEFVNLFSFDTIEEKVTEDKYGSAEIVSVEGQSFDKAMRVETNTVPERTNMHVAMFGTVLKDRFKEGDNALFTCKVRLIDGGVSDQGQLYVSLQEPKTYEKTIWAPIVVTKKWQTVYFPAVMIENYDDFAIRFGHCSAAQTVEIADVKIINYGPEVKGDYRLPEYDGSEKDEILKGAPWRDEALKRIEQVRKGDFKVVVKDKSGNPIPDAQVKFNMFESAFPLGSTINNEFVKEGKERFTQEFSKLFNGGVVEHHMKWGPYEDEPDTARTLVNIARDAGMIYLRGHTMIMDYHITAAGTILLPQDMIDFYDNESYVDKRVKNWIYEISDKFAGEIYQWDVANELTSSNGSHPDSIYTNMGSEYYDKIFKWAREANPDSELFLLEGTRMFSHYMQFRNIADAIYKNENKFDSIGYQAHFGTSWYSPTQNNTMFNEYAQRYNCNIALTEYTMNTGDEIYDANFTRDIFITALANEYVNSFFFWGFNRKEPTQIRALMNADYTLTKAGEQIVDLYYNKCWTRDAKTITDSSGEGAINGFYGSYDVTVTANGQTKTVMAAFHKGYDNVLEITID